jgi:hypothetical protein
METFIIRELENAQSHRDGEKIEAASLAAAKRAASRRQVFQGTVMTIESEHGVVLSVKDGRGWNDADFSRDADA